MRFLTYEYNGVEKIAVLKCDEKTILDIDHLFTRMRGYTMTQFIEEVTDRELEALSIAASEELKKGPLLERVNIKAPIVKPAHDIICVGVNYEDHLKESTMALKDVTLENRSKPVYFSKRAIEIKGHKDEIVGRFDLDEALDYEVELAVIIGKEGRNISVEEAEDYIFGYSIFNDYSSRTLQKDHLQWFKGKSLDGYSVMGPYIVHKDEVNFPPQLALRTYVNGELRQDSHTKELIFDIATLISDFSKGMTLVPGDIIATGTPSGVGMGFTPPKYLKSGDVVVCEIEGLGSLDNHVTSYIEKY